MMGFAALNPSYTYWNPGTGRGGGTRMLSWFQRRREIDTAKETALGARIAINRLGELIEKYPTAVMDETWLPVPSPT